MLGADINCAIERAAGVMCTVLTQLVGDQFYRMPSVGGTEPTVRCRY